MKQIIVQSCILCAPIITSIPCRASVSAIVAQDDLDAMEKSRNFVDPELCRRLVSRSKIRPPSTINTAAVLAPSNQFQVETLDRAREKFKITPTPSFKSLRRPSGWAPVYIHKDAWITTSTRTSTTYIRMTLLCYLCLFLYIQIEAGRKKQT